VYEETVRPLVRCDWSPVTRTWTVRKDRLGDLRVALDRAQVRYTQHDTGCPPPPMVTKERAEYLVRAIKSGLAGLHPMVIEAYEGRAWDALGYTSWKTLCEAEFALTLAIPQRREVVQELTEAGLSTRAQAEVLGVDQRTINRDQVRHNASVTITAEPQSVRGLDGRNYPASQPATTTFSWQDAPASAAPTGPREALGGVVEAVALAPHRGDVRVEATLAGFAADDITATPSRIALLRGACERWLAEHDGWDQP
jgi:hypothetical protein